MIALESLGTVQFPIRLPCSNYDAILYHLWDIDLLVKNRKIFTPNLYVVLLQGVTPSEFCEDVWYS